MDKISKKDYFLYAAIGLLLGVSAVFISGYLIFFCIIGVLLIGLRKYQPEDFKFLLVMVISAVLIRLFAIILLEYILISKGLFSDIFGYRTPALFGDSGYYVLRGLWMSEHWAGMPLSPEIISEINLRNYGYNGYLYFLAFLYKIFGFDTILSRLWTSGFGILLGVNVYLITKEITDNKLAPKIAMVLTLFWPTLFLWSITNLKDMSIAFILSCFAFIMVLLCKPKTFKGYLLAFAFLGLFMILAVFLRRNLIMLLSVPIMLGIFFAIKSRKTAVIVLMLCFILAVMFLNNSYCMSKLRTIINDRILVFHRGSFITGGNVVNVLDNKYYYSDDHGYVYSMPVPYFINVTLKGAIYPLILPFPDRTGKNIMMRTVVSAFMYVWYCVLLLSFAGFLELLIKSTKKKGIIILFVLLETVSASIMITTANIGVIMRWRSLCEPIILIFFSCFIAAHYRDFTKSKTLSFLRHTR